MYFDLPKDNVIFIYDNAREEDSYREETDLTKNICTDYWMAGMEIYIYIYTHTHMDII